MHYISWGSTFISHAPSFLFSWKQKGSLKPVPLWTGGNQNTVFWRSVIGSPVNNGIKYLTNIFAQISTFLLKKHENEALENGLMGTWWTGMFLSLVEVDRFPHPNINSLRLSLTILLFEIDFLTEHEIQGGMWKRKRADVDPRPPHTSTSICMYPHT